jgi:hypothetical protein
MLIKPAATGEAVSCRTKAGLTLGILTNVRPVQKEM